MFKLLFFLLTIYHLTTIHCHAPIRFKAIDTAFNKFKFVSKPEPHISNQLIFAVTQHGQSELEARLKLVSDPTSPDYGKYLTRQQIAAMTTDATRTDTIVNYLTKSGATITRITKYGEYIIAEAPIKVWDSMLSTSFHIYEDNLGDKRIRCYDYEIPEHTHSILNANEVSIHLYI
jgi:tripeptidyl-peptidase I